MNKKRIYFIISTIIQWLIGLFSIVFSEKVALSIVESYKEMYETTKEASLLDTINQYSSNGQLIVIIVSVIIIILNGILLYNLLKKEDFICNKYILFSSIVIGVISQNDWVLVLSIVNLIVYSSGKKKSLKDKESVKDSIPDLERHSINTKALVLAIITLLIYFFLPSLIGLLPFSYITLSIILDISLIVFCLIVFYDDLKRDVILLKSSLKEYFNYIIKKQWIMFIIYLAVSVIIITIKGDSSQSANQTALEALPMLYVIPTSLIYAPFVEELVFRGALRRLIKNDAVFIAVSGISFGLIHTMYEANLFDVILLSLPYCVIGFYLAYLYSKTNNLTSSMIGHFLHNAIACVFMLIA